MVAKEWEKLLIEMKTAENTAKKEKNENMKKTSKMKRKTKKRKVINAMVK
jgi:hypothetical protein